jgi:hypothetical protein
MAAKKKLPLSSIIPVYAQPAYTFSMPWLMQLIDINRISFFSKLYAPAKSDLFRPINRLIVLLFPAMS